MGAMFFAQLLTPFILNEEEPMEIRQQVFLYFGTFTRATLTMFEVTLANWVPACRLLSNNVNEAYAMLFILYKCVVGFAIIKVITGVFLHETFKVAQGDDELMIRET